jgi:hypothetical protein
MLYVYSGLRALLTDEGVMETPNPTVSFGHQPTIFFNPD